MVTAEYEIGLIRPKVVQSVERLCERGHTTMSAYDELGRQIGKSSRWIRKVIGRDETAGIRLRDALNIAAAYERLCNRIGAAADAVEAENQALRRDLDAALQRDRPVVARSQRSGPPETATARGAGAPAASALVPTTARARRRASLPPGDVNDLPLWRGLTEE